MPDAPRWPPTVRAALDAPPLPRRGWQWTSGPQLIALFLWVGYFDQIPQEALPRGGVMPTVLGALVGGLLANLLLFRSPALWGMTTGLPLAVTATSTFGLRGAAWVPGGLFAAAQVAGMAVSAWYGATLCLTGLVRLSLLDPRHLAPWPVGATVLAPRLVLLTAFLWCLAAALVGRYLVRVIAALMNVYPILPAALLAATTVVAFRTIPDFRPDPNLPGRDVLGLKPSVSAGLIALQMVFAFFAGAGLLAADWGTVARGPGDVRAGGWVGLTFASWVVATLAVLSVAGAAGRLAAPDVKGPGAAPSLAPSTFRYTEAIELLVGGPVAGGMLLGFGLAALAPAVYSAFVFSTRMHDAVPRVSRTRWTLLGVAGASGLIVAGVPVRLFELYSVLGALLAPAAGAIAADASRGRGAWPGPRAGLNAPGFLAWGVGAVVGFLPAFGRANGVDALAGFEPSALYAFLFAFLAYRVAAGLLGTSPAVALPAPAPGEVGQDADVRQEHGQDDEQDHAAQ